MRHPKPFVLSVFLALASVGFFLLAPTASLAKTTVTLDQPVHFTTAEGSDVVLDAGVYDVVAADEWLRVTPSEGQAVDALLLEAQVAKHEEALKAPLGVSAQGESPDTHHLALLLPNGKRVEAVGSYSGIRSRGLSLLTIRRLQTLARTTNTEYSTPTFGGSGGTRSYNLDCGSGAVLVGTIYKSGSWLDALGIICQRVNSSTGALGSEFTRGPVGGSGGTARSIRCNQGNVVTKVRAYSGRFVNGFTLSCGQWVPSRKAPNTAKDLCGRGTDGCLRIGTYRFATTSEPFQCPSGLVGKAFRGKYGSYIDSARFVCDFWNK
jgi:hypothetical protein